MSRSLRTAILAATDFLLGRAIGDGSVTAAGHGDDEVADDGVAEAEATGELIERRSCRTRCS